MKYRITLFRATLTIASAFVLSGCFEVEDNNNNAELNATLQQQNQILQAQLEQANQESSISIAGSVVNAFDESSISSANITIRNAFVVFVENQAITDGTFQVEGLPVGTDIQIVISSPSEAFLTRAFYTNTGASSAQVTQRDFGEFAVSEAGTYSINVQNATTGESITGLEFSANSTVGNGTGDEEFKHVSTYDSASGVYNIILPKDINTEVVASLDADRDGRLDYEPMDNIYSYISGTKVVINSSSLLSLPTISFLDIVTTPDNEVEFRIALLKADGTYISSAEVAAQNDASEDFSATFDAASNQYVLAATFESSLSIQSLGFTEEDVNYSNVSIGVFEANDTQYQLQVSGGSFYSNFYLVDKTDVVNVVVQPSVVTSPVTNLEVVLTSDPAQSDDNSYSVFYSQPISVGDDQVSLVNNDAFTVIKGDDASDDVVLPGTTLIDGNDVSVEIVATLSLNDTRLTLTPSAPLQGDTRYAYSVELITSVGSDTSVDFTNDSSQFITPIIVSDTPFVITDVMLDNVNYANQGAVITPSNTAGITDTNFNTNNYVRLFLPISVNQLKTLTLNQVSVTQDGVASNSFDTDNLVTNENVSANRQLALRLNRNENIQTSAFQYSYINGSNWAQNELVYVFSNYSNYMADNTATNENSITYEYAFETKAGEIETGTITLPVQ